jgi:CRP-like cAMP-binding protein
VTTRPPISTLSLKERVHHLQKVDIFTHTAPELLLEVAPLLKEVRYAAGECVIEEGEMGDCMYIIVSGEVNVHRGAHVFASLGAGRIVGELALLTSNPRSASVTAKMDCVFLRYDQVDFYDTMGERIEFTRSMIGILTERLTKQNSSIIKNLQQREKELSRLVTERTAALEAEKAKVESTNAQLTDSITYASRIQNAVLGNEGEICSRFTEAFILLQPRDIVSGDFYWYAEVQPKGRPAEALPVQVLIAEDCTGHGVPGAFMTVMGSSFLEDIVNSKRITDPAAILYALDQKVTQATHRHQNDTEPERKKVNDGMDMAILTIDRHKRKVYFAGAKNPLLYFEKGKSVQTFKGSKFPIGSRQFRKPKRFDTQEIPYTLGASYYIFSDGFPDQFGGPEGRKYLTRRFRGFLHEIQRLPMREQKPWLEEEFRRWQGTRPQTDDVLVVGVRL